MVDFSRYRYRDSRAAENRRERIEKMSDKEFDKMLNDDDLPNGPDTGHPSGDPMPPGVGWGHKPQIAVIKDEEQVGSEAAPAPPPIILSDEQQRVMDAVEEGNHVLVTGPAGTGKSTILKALQNRFPRLPVTASTGIAAVGVGGLTIHSFLGLGIGDRTGKQIAHTILGEKGKHYDNIKLARQIAIDEISMISARMLEKIDEILRIVRKTDKPFGGIQMIFFGDFLQLPPVIKGREVDGFAFESPLWTAAEVQVFVLTKIFRQADAEFAQALNDIRVGAITPLVSKLLNSRYKKDDPDPTVEAVVVHTHNANVDEINSEKLMQLPGEYQTFVAVDEGRESAKKMLEKNCLAPTILSLKMDAQVMLLTNLDTGAGLANGSLGKVSMLTPGNVYVKFANGIERFIEPAEWEIKDNGRVIATRKQIPLRLAWAITTHKSQGQTLDKIRVFLGKVFEDGQAYVALSRARTLDGLFIDSGNKTAIRASAKALEFYRINTKTV